MKLQRIRGVLMCSAIAMAPLLAAAHHSVQGQFDVRKNVATEGTLTRVELINPHSYLHFNVKNAAGKEEEWSFETAAPLALKRAGISVRDSLKTGRSYKFTYSPARKPNEKIGLLHSIVLEDGKFVAVSAGSNIEAARESIK